ncbi:larval cuticle protein 65Ag1-like [Malaya genurostris]|uniref:larval cuticle protein 65Ag1-like n=1 Tax=Malaya genurostris TaxID=325434 RepID=UPI0026F3C355|nr:larval cuticle protein 65Ag1-like [Malaya genurostris]
MLKFTIVWVAIFGAVLAAPQQQRSQFEDPNGITVLRQNAINNNEAGYQFTYEQSNKQIFSELGTPKDTNGGARILAVEGAYSFVGPDGQTHWVTYRADENGFLPKTGTGASGGIQPGQDAPVRT